MSTAAAYAEFASREARGVSPAYERLAFAVASDADVVALLDTLPPGRRQPNLLFAVARLLGGPVHDADVFGQFVRENWPVIEAEMRARATQTNEAGRCAVLLPVLAALPQPVALLEVGASAGLCLYPDRYAYRYGTQRVGAGEPVLDCTAARRRPSPPPTRHYSSAATWSTTCRPWPPALRLMPRWWCSTPRCSIRYPWHAG